MEGHGTIIQSTQTNPYWNLAVENYLLSRSDADGVVLYLWANHRTVVIGQNQNPYAECAVDQLLADGGYVMRRATGGGAVYHDDGNLNFSFVAPHALYDQQRQFSVIMKALESFGLKAECSGRNDLLCQGRKFSGSAFSKGRYQNLHHGTLLIRGNIIELQRYLHPKPAKLLKHGVQSVQSRVVNLSELNDAITPKSIAPKLLEAFCQIYDSNPRRLDFDELLNNPEVEQLYNKYSSHDWIFGRWQQFDAQRSAQFDWGGVDVSLQVDTAHDCIVDVNLATDSLDTTLAERLRTLLVGASASSVPQLPADADDSLKDIVNLIFS